MDTLIAAFLEHHVTHLTVAAEVRGTIRLYFDPLRTYSLPDLTPLVIESWFHTIGKSSKSQANKSLSILRTMLEKAKHWRLFEGENAARQVKPYTMRTRTRFVQPKEMPLLMQSLKREDEPTQCYFLLCLLVGCRRTEGLLMKWEDLDTAACVWSKPRTKTGIPHTVPVPAALMARIAALDHRNEFVFSTMRSTHWSASLAYEKWCSIRKGAGLADVTIHDLRRTCASWLAIHGENLAVIG
ncbi:MAG: site-specific integrase, partial [Pseudomonadota bacterium]